MPNQFSRLELIYGSEGISLLQQKTVAVLGAGGVGSYAMEALARSGIGHLVLIDKDVVDITNINRQLPALWNTINRSKVEVMKERIAQINPLCRVEALQIFFNESNRSTLFDYNPDYVVDAIDMVSAKIMLIADCIHRDIPIVASMGAANKLDPTGFRVMDLADTKVDPIAKILRRELRKLGIERGVKTVCSLESPRPLREAVRHNPAANLDNSTPVRKTRQPPASTAYVPSVAGLILASVVIHDLLGVHL
ncbi:tRNA threonylcarbamoyladenosine dehydratase [Alicyclobacillaceae bacterium I2511]|nr:tRNA threonylcarbamoyladenosine dehydratase [Alicyclobacillaceae bacterium I2511]